MKKFYIIYTEECGEVEGAFNEEGELLGLWSCNDACWRGEYFTFLKKLGVSGAAPPKTLRSELEKKLIAEANRCWG